MTERLYDHGHIMQFTAAVLDCQRAEGGWAVTLDRTAFFPGGGGQSADSGLLGGVRVIGMEERGGVLIHRTEAPLAAGTVVEGRLDADLRLRRMQNHSGEHILSGLFHREYGLSNVGFHMGSEDVTLDLDGELTPAQLERVESMANAIVAQNLPVTVAYPDPAALAALDYRSKLALTENVRIVSIGEEGEVDRCACCAPHVERTGEIGIIKLLDHIRYKGGVRIHLLCGLDALDDYRARYTAVSAIATSLSVKQRDAAAAVARLGEELSAERARQSALSQRLIALHLAGVTAGHPALFFEPAFHAGELRRLVNEALSLTPISMALSGDDTVGYTYVLASPTQPCRALSRAMHEALGGKGGGSDLMAQGRLPAARADIEAWWRALAL